MRRKGVYRKNKTKQNKTKQNTIPNKTEGGGRRRERMRLRGHEPASARLVFVSTEEKNCSLLSKALNDTSRPPCLFSNTATPRLVGAGAHTHTHTCMYTRTDTQPTVNLTTPSPEHNPVPEQIEQ